MSIGKQKLIYSAAFILCALAALVAFEGEPLFFGVFSLLALGLPLTFVGYHKAYLVSLLQAANFFWFVLIVPDASGTIFFVFVASVILLRSLGHRRHLPSGFRKAVYPLIVLAVLVFGLEVALRESFLNDFLDVKVRRADLVAHIARESNYIFNHNEEQSFVDSCGRSFSQEKPKGTKRIVCLGSSSTHGHGAGLKAYPVRLEELLQQSPQPIEVINAGQGGARLYGLYVYLREVLLGLDPDIVIVYFGYNGDPQSDAYYLEEARNVTKSIPSIDNMEDLEIAMNFRYRSKSLLNLYRALFSSRVFSALTYGLQSVFSQYRGETVDEEAAAAHKRETVRKLAELCESHGITVVFVPEVIMYDNGEYMGYFRDIEERESGVYYFQPQRAGLIEHLEDSIHCNEAGYLNLARQIVRFLTESGILSQQINQGLPARRHLE